MATSWRFHTTHEIFKQILFHVINTILHSWSYNLYISIKRKHSCTVVPTKSDSDVIFCLQLLSKTLTCALHLKFCESRDQLCINPILRIWLIYKWFIGCQSPITLKQNMTSLSLLAGRIARSSIFLTSLRPNCPVSGSTCSANILSICIIK